MRNKGIILLSILALLPLLSWGQQRPVYSQYLFNGLVINPAYTGFQKQINATVQYRDQWINFEGAPSVQTVSVHAGLTDRKIGVGGMISRDQVGIHQDYAFYGFYSYQIDMLVGKLSLGLQGGFNYRTDAYSLLNKADPNDPDIAVDQTRFFKPNFGTGAYFYNERFFAGISIPYLLAQPVFEVSEALNQVRDARNYYIMGGMIMEVSDNVRFRPSTLLRFQDGSPLGMDLTGTMIFYDKIFAGIGWRSGDAIMSVFEVQLNDNFRFGYSFDFITSDVRQYANGSHEFMISYRVQLTPDPCLAYF